VIYSGNLLQKFVGVTIVGLSDTQSNSNFINISKKKLNPYYEEGDGMSLRNVVNYFSTYATSYPTRPESPTRRV
jgi:hypothetical protein